MNLKYFKQIDFDKTIEGGLQTLKNHSFTPDLIVTFPRGGLVPATYFSHQLNVPILIIDSSKYDFKQALKLTADDRKKMLGKNVLIIDDIIDTGETIEEFLFEADLTASGDFFIITMAANATYHNPSIEDRWYFDTLKSPDEFLVFPWEKQ